MFKATPNPPETDDVSPYDPLDRFLCLSSSEHTQNPVGAGFVSFGRSAC
jgi:hypothetical protein